MTKFRPCIDLHNGQVKQIVGGTLSDDGAGLKENFVAEASAEEFAQRYREDGLGGGHVIQLGPGNREAALGALGAWPGGMQLGGGVTIENAESWLEAGASQVIVTSWLFDGDGVFRMDRLKELSEAIGRERLVVDLSCRRTERGWTVAMNRWQTLTDVEVNEASLDRMAEYCAEYLVHAADVEGLCGGVDLELVELLGSWGKIPMTYAGGVGVMDDVLAVDRHSGGKLDLTVGSALDIFGGSGVEYEALVNWNRRE
ncbi:phosphoribosylformimino-5-aminoimidazole carboxamide ribotide isomerase [Rubritalea tangerina]|uniref:Phosphoribosylformimino-5-aminoimidazole carboxamide ribotide isomerase n=1 Tax=Rubritalea tangerina TaxID=430798 RepID=A0ABW4Z9I2_9BACT